MTTDPDDKVASFAKVEADLWAQWHGFDDADDMNESGKRAESERLAELASNKGAK